MDRYRCLHSIGFQVTLINVKVGARSIECGAILLPAGIGDRTPWLYDLETGNKVCRAIVPEEDRSPQNNIVYHSVNDDLILEKAP
jgi:hypothetical protein